MRNKFDVIEASIDDISVIGFIISKTEKSIKVCYRDPKSGEIEMKNTNDGITITGDANPSTLPISLNQVLEHYKEQDSRIFKKGDKVSFIDPKSRKILKGIIESNMGEYSKVLMADGSHKRVLKTSFQ